MHAQRKWGSYCKSELESSALYNYGQKTICGQIWREALLKRSVSVVVVLTLSSICIPEKLFFFPPCISTWVCFEQEYIPHFQQQTALSVLFHAFMLFSLPAPGWVCPIMPRGFHSSPWQSSSLKPSQLSYQLPCFINPIRTCAPDDLQCALTFLASAGLTSHAVTCTVEQADWVSRGSGWCYRCEAAPPVCEEGGRALRRNALPCELLTAGLSS